MSQPKPETDLSFKPLTKAERIQQLNDIDKSITTLLHSAGLALKTLTDSSSSPSSRRTAFQSASESYLKTLQKADISLKRQIWGLEEADIIPAEKAKGKEGKEGKDMFAMGGARVGGDVKEGRVEEGGMGKLDIGWLNSRGGRVERDMEAELWGRARVFLEGDGKGKEGNREGKGDGDGDVEMGS
ncbi:hypothetical protein LSUB1_G003881 [Lachnellula subtilissima]|uniref:Mediator of RNA polymerase II transcription subunit 11 n=1 Tax=Lachnellula subtilissima TaxID=602034 RepID=A0A8H8RXK8_9HELO|nr:hypothetical protein LSUB1_G003881 [Lachnellula subtilissima]